MKNPFAITPTDEVTTVGRVFGVPVVVKGRSWYPLMELGTWMVMIWLGGRRRPRRSLAGRAGVAALTMPVFLGSEWSHNLAHAAAARAIGRPMDALRIVWGMPLCVYYDINDAQVTPRQHMLRAMGGPIWNGFLLLISLLLRRRARPGSVSREVADVAVGMNGFLAGASLLPLPAIDGGPLLKWGLVERGRSIPQADEIVKRVDAVLGVGLLAGSAVAARKRNWIAGAMLLLSGILSLGFATGRIREQ
jgi:Zn-dependent protease